MLAFLLHNRPPNQLKPMDELTNKNKKYEDNKILLLKLQKQFEIKVLVLGMHKNVK